MKDKIYHIFVGVIVGLPLFGGFYFFNDVGISEKWLLFIEVLIIYFIATFYVVTTDKIIKFQKLNFYHYFVVFVIIISPLIIVFSLLYFRIIPIPDYLFPYLIF